MGKTLKMLVAAAVVFSGVFGSAGLARADIEDASGNNVQEGDNRSTGRQNGRSASGDAVGGQVVGTVSSGRTSVDATNRSQNVDVTSGDADGTNRASNFTGLNHAPVEITDGGNSVPATDISNVPFADNLQEGDNRSSLSQSADATTGDGVGGQVIGVVTAAGGSASVVAANTSRDSSIETGDSEANNDATAFSGLNNEPVTIFVDDLLREVDASDIDNACFVGGGCANVQEGDNRLTGNQSARAATGDGVGGQVLGVVSAGATSLDATNLTENSDVSTGDADANNAADEFVGLNNEPLTVIFGDLLGRLGEASDIEDVPFAANLQEGDNRRTFNQAAEATSGDAVAGQVSGVVTSAGGSASVVLANRSDTIDASTGESEFDNDETSRTGLNNEPVTLIGAPVLGGILS